MGVRFATVTSNTFIGPLPATNAETVVLTSPPISLALDNAQVLLLWTATVTTGTSATGLTYRIRRGTTTAGTLVFTAPANLPANAGLNYTVSGWYFDSPGVVAGQQYSLTIVQLGVTVAGTWLDGALGALVL